MQKTNKIIGFILLVMAIAAIIFHATRRAPSNEVEKESEDIVVEKVEEIEVADVQEHPSPTIKTMDTDVIYIDNTSKEETDILEEEEANDVSPTDLEYLACAIYKEAGSDSVCDICRHRVADIILNRVESPLFPNTIEEVLLQDGQYNTFSWEGIVWPEESKTESEAHAVERAYEVATDILVNGNHSDLYGDGYYIWQAEFPQGISDVYCCRTYYGHN